MQFIYDRITIKTMFQQFYDFYRHPFCWKSFEHCFKKHICSTDEKQLHFSDYFQRRVQNPVEYLQWSFFSKITILFNRYLSFQKSSIIYIRLSSKYTSDSIHPSRLFCRENNTNFQVLPNGRKILYPWYNIKKKINLYTLTIFNKF